MARTNVRQGNDSLDVLSLLAAELASEKRVHRRLHVLDPPEASRLVRLADVRSVDRSQSDYGHLVLLENVKRVEQRLEERVTGFDVGRDGREVDVLDEFGQDCLTPVKLVIAERKEGLDRGEQGSATDARRPGLTDERLT